ncbi:MAG: SDR family oxidoreductase [Deltaproteobacteria bacterium]|nr:SDR family oxidoreductase [Deltaproteobacteria bacterium]
MSEPSEVFGLKERVAVITGAASGIGRSVGQVLAQAGARVVLGDLDGEGAEVVAAEIRDSGGEAVAQEVDVAQRAEVEALVERATTEFGGLDIICNVAGIPADGPLEDFDEKEFDRVYSVNFKGTLYGCQAAIPAMAKRGGGSIINVASAAIDLPTPNYGVYAITKASVAQLTQTLATEVGDRGIRVNAIAPGITVSNFTKRRSRNPDGSINQANYDGFMSSMRDLSPIGRIGQPEDQAWLVLYLASEASRFCTGQIWRANGGAASAR